MGHDTVKSTRRRQQRRIAVITGTRAEYGLLKSPMEQIAAHRRLRLQVVAVGMHLLRKFGRTVDQIARDSWRIDARVKMQTGDDGLLDQAYGLARGVSGIAKFLEAAKTDIVVVLGDRIEAMAGALAAVTTGRPVAHIHGGDKAPGDFDERLRHAITKLAEVHFAATQAARKRIIRMGEASDSVHCVGAPGLDELVGLLKRVTGPKERTGRALIVQHPTGRGSAHERKVMNTILKAVEQAQLSRTIVYPNSDRGHTGVVEAIETHRRRACNGSVRVFRSLDREMYLRTLIDADVLVGNSSSGIIESATAGTASVNVGYRQQGRERSGPAVLDADESLSSIRTALAKTLKKRPIIGRATVYGDGRAGERIAHILAVTPL